MRQDDSWEKSYREVMDYMNKHKRRPSKHRIEDHQMLNWIKYNKKRKARGKMPENRIEDFNKLLETAEKYRRTNQYSYAGKSSEQT